MHATYQGRPPKIKNFVIHFREEDRNREKKREKRENKREEDRNREKKREIEKKKKGEKRRETDVQGQLLSICIQFSKRKT